MPGHSGKSDFNMSRWELARKTKEYKQGFVKIVPNLWINGKLREVDFATWPLAESPVMTLNDSILRITQGGDRVEVDWSGELPRISRR